MRKFLKYLIVVSFLMMTLISCGPNGSDIGPFLEIRVKGAYIDENTGEQTNYGQELKTLVNIASKTFFGQQKSTKGKSAHVNGFICKGLFDEGTEIRLRVVDKNYKTLPLLTDLAGKIKLGSTSNFNFDIIDDDSAFNIIKGKSIKININVFSYAQARRLRKLMNDGVRYNEAYEQSQNEVLAGLGMTEIAEKIGEEIDEDTNEDYGFPDFHELDIRNEGDQNGLLLVASAILSEKDLPDGSYDSLLDTFSEQIKENGELDDDTKALIKNKKASINIDTVVDNLNDSINLDGNADDNIPEPSKRIKDWLKNGQ